MKIILTGPKGSGKTTIGRELAEMLGIPFYDTDSCIEDAFLAETGRSASFREIYNEKGEQYFRDLENRCVRELSGKDWCLIATGGSTMYNPDSRNSIRENSLLILLKADDEFLWQRITRDGLPSFLPEKDGRRTLAERNTRLYQALEHISDIVFTVNDENQDRVVPELFTRLCARIMLDMRSPSTIGEIIRTTTFGESHGPAVGAVLDGIRPGIELSPEDIQRELDRRRPGQSAVTTPRNEEDRVHILSGIFEGKTTGCPICMLIYNRDQDSSRYNGLREVFRPGHADFTFWKKFGIRDHRGGGRSSGRETAGRVASGAAAKKILADRGIRVTAFAQEIAGIQGVTEDFSHIENNSVRAADPSVSSKMEEAVLAARNQKDSVGGIVKLVIHNIPPGIGDPVFFKLDARLGMAMLSIGAVKGIEFGAGFASSRMRGSENNDRMKDGSFESNNAGGILGGISTGQDIIARIAVKPTPSIAQEQDTIDLHGANRSIKIEGRHDPCIVPRIIPVIEAMAALVVLDALEIQNNLGKNDIQ